MRKYQTSWGCTGPSSAQTEIEILLQLIYIRFAVNWPTETDPGNKANFAFYIIQI